MSINPFANTAKASASVTEAPTGGSVFAVPETGAYKATMQYIYLQPNAKKPQNTDMYVVMTLDNGYKWTMPIYSVLVNNSPFSSKPGEDPKLLYGFQTATRIMRVFVNKTLEEAAENMQAKIIEIYDFASSKGIPTTVQVFADSLGAEAWVGLTRKVVNKKTLIDGVYVNTPERKEEAVLSSMASATTGQTYTELLENADPVKFAVWLEGNKGKNWEAYVPVGAVPSATNTPTTTLAGTKPVVF